jgi:hypothetical protein
MKVISHARHSSRMHHPPPSGLACPAVLGLAFALALPACVLSEQFSAGTSDGSSTGDAGAMSGSVPDATPGTTGMHEDDATTRGGGRHDATSTADDDDASSGSGSGGPEDVPQPETTDTSSGASVFGTDCCTPSEGIGCGDPLVEACVCDVDPYCCEREWDNVCVDLMIDVGCLSCDSSTQLVPNTCCAPTGEPGCPEAAVSECVCAIDPFCCDVLWDETCVALVEANECGMCQPAPCCAPSTMPGCAADPEIEACVCAADPFCCDEQWDNLCVSDVQTVGCGDCGWVSEGGGCCDANGTPGCDDPDIEACVCPSDPFCCQTSWDSLCVEMVGTYGCAMCPIEPGTGETGNYGGSGSGGSGGSDSGDFGSG